MNFNNVDIELADLSNTGAEIDPQLVKNKSLYDTNLENLDLSSKDFTNVVVEYACLKNTNATINVQQVREKSLQGANLLGVTIVGDFNKVDITESIFDRNSVDITGSLDKDIS